MSENQECLSDFAIDRYLAGEHEDPAAVENRVESCDHCRARLEALQTDGEQAREMLPPLPEAPRGRGAWVGVLAVAAGFLLALSLAWALMPPEEDGVSVDSELVAHTRTKGRARMTVYVRRGDRVFTFGGEVLQEGDELAFSYTSATDTYLAVFDIDGGDVTLLHPSGPSMLPAGAGVDVELELAVELDDSVSEESIVAVFCDQPTSTAELTVSLESPGGLRDGCVSDSVELRKAGRP